MRSVFGLVEPDTGSVRYDDAPIDGTMRLRFGYMPEERGLYPRMRVRDQLIYFARMSGMSAADAAASVDRWLETFDLTDRADSKLEELSHGNQQRIQLAAAIVHEPELLVLDEPFAGLDPIGVDSLSTVLRDFATSGAGILFSSHQLDLVEHVCQDGAIIQDGTIVVQGDLAELKDSAGYRRVEIRVNGTLWDPPVGGAHRVDAGGRIHHIIDASIEVEDLLNRARQDGPITRFSYEPPSLSDIFHEAVST